jgi:hypothetical protein
MSTKTELWNRILSATNTTAHRPSITINRPRALKAKEKGDPQGKNSVFGQAVRFYYFLYF